MNQEKYLYNEDDIELLDEEKSLILLNDDVNTFDYVIEVLMRSGGAGAQSCGAESPGRALFCYSGRDQQGRR